MRAWERTSATALIYFWCVCMKPSIAFSSPDFAASMSSDGIFLLRKLAFLELLPLCG